MCPYFMEIKKDSMSGKKYCMIRAILSELYKKETDSGSFPIHCYTGNKFIRLGAFYKNFKKRGGRRLMYASQERC